MSYGSVYDPGYGPGLLGGGDISFGQDSLPAAIVNDPGLDTSAQDEQDAYYASLPDSDPLKINWLQNKQSMALANAYGGYNKIPVPELRNTLSWLKYVPTVAGALAGYGVGAGVGALAGTAAPAGGAIAGGSVAAPVAGSTVAPAVGGMVGDTVTILGGTGGSALSGAGAAGGLLGAGVGATPPADPSSPPADPNSSTVTVNGTRPTGGIPPADAGGLLGGGLGAITNPLDPNYNPSQDPSPDQTGQKNDTTDWGKILKNASSAYKLLSGTGLLGGGAGGAAVPGALGGSGSNANIHGGTSLMGSQVYGPQGNLLIRAPHDDYGLLSSLLMQKQ